MHFGLNCMNTPQNPGFDTYKRLLSSLKPYWAVLLLGVFATAIASGTDAGFTWFLRPLLDKGFIGQDIGFLRWLPVIVVTAFLVRSLAGFVSDFLVAWVGRRMVMQFRQKVFAHFVQLPTAYYDNASSGQMLSTLIYNIDQIAKASTTALINVLRSAFVTLGLFSVMLVNSWRLTCVFLLTAPIIAFIATVTSRRMRKSSRMIQESMAHVTHVAEEAIEGHQVVKSFGGQITEIEKFNDAANINRQREMKVVVADAMGTGLVQITVSFAIAFTIYLATSTSKYGISAGTFISMIAAMLAILKPMKTLTTVNSVIQRGIAAAESIFDVLDMPLETDTGEIQLTEVKGDIDYRDIQFRYDNMTRDVLQGISFQVPAGKTVALVGRSGSGKSTLVGLLSRFYQTQQGEITIDGHPISSLTLSSLRHQISIVSQQVMLFNDTIANNIAYGTPDASREDIEKAAELAYALPFIHQMPKGLDTVVGENGVLLSGGQRQRLAIARAILKDAPILILDEATSALDSESERMIQAALEALMKDRTTLVIAHRLSTVESADQILVLDQGQIIEQGDHASLLDKAGYYAQLYKMQFEDE